MLVDHPYSMLKIAWIKHLHEELEKKLYATTDSCEDKIPQFQECGVCHGRYHISCNNVYSYQWLKTQLTTLLSHLKRMRQLITNYVWLQQQK